jgi:hypothetical protein
MTSGLYKKPIEVLARKVQYEPLPPELRAVVIASWTLHNVLPRAAIEQMVPAQIEGGANAVDAT